MRSLFALLILCTPVFSQEIYCIDAACPSGTIYSQCPGGSCRPYSGGQYYYYQQRPPQRQPAPPASPEAPAPDGIQTPPVGSPGTPEFPQVKPNAPTTPPQDLKPVQPVNPPIQDESWKEEIKKHWAEIDKQRADENKRHAELVEAIKAGGCKCKPVDLTIINQKLDLVIAAQAANKPLEAPPAEEHVVVVADHNSPYWPRLSETMNTARKTYSGIYDTTLPEFPIGTHPKCVCYKNSTPVRIIEGEYQVEDFLTRLGRGEIKQF